MVTSRNYHYAFWDNLKGVRVETIQNDLRESDDGVGNHILPAEYREKYEATLAKANVFRRYANIVITSPSEDKIEAISSIGTADWIESGTQIPESFDKFAQIGVRSHRLAALSRIKNTFISDTRLNVEKYLENEFARRFDRAEEKAFINGDGITQPYSILHPAQGAKVGVTAASATEISFDEIKELFFSLASEYRRNGVWLMKDKTAFHLRTLKDPAGNYLWRDRDDSIFTRPVVTSPYMPDMEAGASSIVFADLSYF